MYRSSPFRTTLNTGYITALDMCEVCTEAVHCEHFDQDLHHSFGHVWSVPTAFGHARSMYGRSPLRSTLNTGYITALDMCEVCTEAVHSVALWTWVTSQLSDMCEVCTEAVRSVALWTRVTSKLWTCVRYVPKQKQEQEQKQGRQQQQQQQQGQTTTTTT